MTADTFAKLVTLQALIDAEVGYHLRHHPPVRDALREGMVARISDLIDEIDALDALAAARVYDAIVDFLAELPDDDAGLVEAALRFKRAVDRIVERGMDGGSLGESATWAAVLDELLEVLNAEYARAATQGAPESRERLRAEHLLMRARAAADRIVRGAGAPALSDALDRLSYAVGDRRLPVAEVEAEIRAAQRLARRYRAAKLSRVGAYVIGRLLRRPVRRKGVEGPAQ